MLTTTYHLMHFAHTPHGMDMDHARPPQLETYRVACVLNNASIGIHVYYEYCASCCPPQFLSFRGGGGNTSGGASGGGGSGNG